MTSRFWDRPLLFKEKLTESTCVLRYCRLAANHANNCTKLGTAGACEILVKLLKRPQQHVGEFVVEMKLHSTIYWALANLVQHTKDTTAVADAAATTTHHRSSIAGVQSSTKSAHSHATTAATTAVISSKQIKNSSRLHGLNIADVVMTTLARSLDYGNAAVNSQPQAIPYVTFLWGCRLLVSLCKSQRIKLQLVDNGAVDLVERMGSVAEAQAKTEGTGKEYTDLLEWASMAKDVLSSSELCIA
jgi:hypothetical protein